ncbi:MAG TPA: S8 family peptidase, partial [Glaciibacter sp.]|nr:S8 family peptidase [Glaciibacter sp.]
MRRVHHTVRRHNWRGAAALVCIPVLLSSGLSPAAATTEGELGTYIVDASTSAALDDAIGTVPGERADVLPDAGVAIVELTDVEAATLRSTPGVTVATDAPLAIADTQDSAPWHLDRLDQDRPSSGTAVPTDQYWYPGSAGNGVRIYVLDTGVFAGHQDFGSRVVEGYDAITQLPGATSDCNGHGTAVASAAAGTQFGVAKRASIVPVRVASCTGSATTSDMIRGLDWIMHTHPEGVPGVVNVSLGALDKNNDPAYTALEDVVASIITSGLFVSVAAGNNGTATDVPEACQFSPARIPAAFTAAASDRWVDEPGSEGRAEFSNAGSCVDAFAPGTGIMTASVTPPDVMRNGTSFAAPIVAGLAAIHLADHTADTPAVTTDVLLATAQPDALTNTASRPLGSTVHYNGSDSPTPVVSESPNLLVRTPAAMPDTAAAVVGLRHEELSSASFRVAWDAPTTGVRLTITGGGQGPATTVAEGTSHTFAGLTEAADYLIEARTVTDGLLGTDV